MKNLDYEVFDKWLCDELYLKKKSVRKEIIALTKFGIENELTVKWYEDELEKKGFDEITIKNISDYVMIWNIRNEQQAVMNRKTEDYNFIKKFTKISVKKICDENKIDYSNLIKGKSSERIIKFVREALEEEIKKL